MTYKLLKQIIEDNGIPSDVKLMSDSGWECYATDMDAIYYNENDNVLVFTQASYADEIVYAGNPNWVLLYKGDENNEKA